MDTKLNQEFKDLGVDVIYLFGSRIESLEQPDSDLDIAVLMNRQASQANILNLHTKLYDIFAQVFPDNNLDIVLLHRAPLELRFDVISHGRVYFETNPQIRLDFEERTAREYADFKPILRSMDQAILNRI